MERPISSNKYQRAYKNMTSNVTVSLKFFVALREFAVLGYVDTGTISYRYRTGLIFGTEKLTVHTGSYPLSYQFLDAIVPFGSISHQNKQKKI